MLRRGASLRCARVSVVAVGTLWLASCHARSAPGVASTVPSAPAPVVSPRGASPHSVPARKALLLAPSDSAWRVPAPVESHLRFETTRGVFVLKLMREWGPIGADRFYNMVRLGYFDDSRVHRVRAGYIAQFGVHGDSAVNAAWVGQYLQDDPKRSQNRRGTFAFAYEGPGKPDTRNTQIYINLEDNARNDVEHFTVLGTVVQGMEVVASLYAGYGEDAGGGVRQGRQGPLLWGGNAYMDARYPRLDRIISATVQSYATR
jgi:cyclophilin family peptidyl-prolyl cis-trans isomerase